MTPEYPDHNRTERALHLSWETIEHAIRLYVGSTDNRIRMGEKGDVRRPIWLHARVARTVLATRDMFEALPAERRVDLRAWVMTYDRWLSNQVSLLRIVDSGRARPPEPSKSSKKRIAIMDGNNKS